MACNWKLRSAKTFALAALVGAVALLTNALAQEKGAAPKATWLTAGFVRPGVSADGKVAEGMLDGALGGTIYYAVYQLPSGKVDASDPYNTGMGEFAKQFVPGAKSPAQLVPEKSPPKYLYLYQVVNDRGLDTAKDGIRLAAQTDIKTRDIGNLILRLSIDPSMIQSWGYFKEAGFSISAMDVGSGKVAPVSLLATTQMGVSANPAVLAKVGAMNAQGYSKMATPVAFKSGSGFAVDKAGKNLKNSRFMDELDARKTKLVAWEQELKASAASGGDVPDAVEVLTFKDGDKTKASAVVRASFGANPLKAGRHSVLIGFTSNMAPGNDLVRIQDAAAKKDGIRTVAMDDIDFGAGGVIPMPKEQGKDVAAELGAGRPNNLMVQGIVSPGDIPSGTKLVDKGSYKTFGGTVYFAVYRKTATGSGDTWGVGRTEFDSLFVPGESYRATFSPRLDTEAEYLYLYQVVNDRGFHDLKLPQNKTAIETVQVAADVTEERTPITREVASFSLFLRTDPRLITSWGYFEDAGFNVKVPTETDIKQMAVDPAVKPAGMNMAVSSNLSILDTLYPNKDKEYRSWVPPVQVDFSRTTFGVGKDTANINANRNRGIGNDRAGGLRLVANKTLDKVQEVGAIRPDYTQVIYFDGQNPVNGATIDGITLGPAEVARALFKVEWLTKTVTEGHHSVVFGFTSNAEPVRAPVRIKDLNATIKNSAEGQERVFLSPSQIQSMALNAIKTSQGTAPGAATGAATGAVTGAAIGNAAAAKGSAIGQVANTAAPGSAAAIALVGLNADAPDAAVAVAEGLGQGIIPAGLATLARGSVGAGVAISPAIATPNAGAAGEAAGGGGAGAFGLPPVAASTGGGIGGGGIGGGGIGGGFGAPIGGLGAARMPMFAGGGSGGGSGGSSGGASGSSTQGSSGASNQGSAGSIATNNNNINVNVSQANQQTQSQTQFQHQHQHQNQNQRQNQSNRGHHHHGHNGHVVPAPASLLLGLIGVPGLYLVYRRRRGNVAADPVPEAVAEERPI